MLFDILEKAWKGLDNTILNNLVDSMHRLSASLAMVQRERKLLNRKKPLNFYRILLWEKRCGRFKKTTMIKKYGFK